MISGMNHQVQVFHKTESFPITLNLLATTWAEVKQLATKQIDTTDDRVKYTERISVRIRYRELPDSMVVRFNGKEYNVTEINYGNFKKDFIILYCERLAGVR